MELAFLIAPFLMIVLTIFETGLHMYRSQIMEGAAQEAAREIRTGQLRPGSEALTQFMAKVCEQSFDMVDCNVAVDVRTFADFDEVYEDADGDGVYDNLPEAEFDEDGNMTNSEFDLGDGSTVVVVRLIRTTQFSVPGVSALMGTSTSPFQVYHTVVFQTEPF